MDMFCCFENAMKGFTLVQYLIMLNFENVFNFTSPLIFCVGVRFTMIYYVDWFLLSILLLQFLIGWKYFHLNALYQV